MNRKRDKGFESPRPFKLTHQVVCINNINFQRKSVIGYVELTIVPTVANLNRIKLNSKQCRIYRVRINDLEASFIYNDPTLEVCHSESKQRNLNYFSSAYTAAVSAVDPDGGHGELVIKVPSELWKQGDESHILKVYIEYSLDQPKGGLHFVVPDMEGSLSERGAHVFSFGHHNSTRFWFPCVDSYSELCTWKLEFTIDSSMVAVSCGDLVETIYTHDMRKKTFHYTLSIPTAAPNISLAVGPFEILVDPYMHEVTHFCLPQLLPLLKHSMSYLHEVFEFYEEILTCRYPYSCFKTVFVDESYVQVSSYASMSIFSTNLLHNSMIIDQTPLTRRCLAQALAQQFFGVFISRMSWADEWVLKGISGYIFGLYLKKTFGVNEYRHWIREELHKIVEYELKMGGVLLHPTFIGVKEKDNPTPHLHFSLKHPHTLSWEYYKMFQCKAHLVMRLIENRISMEFMLQVFNKLLSLASTASSQRYQSHMWSQMLLSTHAFLKSISNVSGKDIAPLIKQWVDQSAVVKFFGSFAFNRKRNVLELEIRQDYTSSGTQKYVGPIKVTVQELDGSFNHTLQIEENSLKHDIPCHSKSRRNKKKKIPLMNGEEVDMDLSAMDADSPLLWIRIDPDMSILRKVELEQADFMWQYQLRYERDVVAQEEAIFALESFPTPASRLALTDILEQEQCFYKVRIQACFCLAKWSVDFASAGIDSISRVAKKHIEKIANAMVSTWQGPPAMKSLFTRMFCCKSCPNIVKTNNFINFQSYFLQKTMPVAMALLRDVQNLCPRDVLNFILDLIKYNDNRKNKFSDNYYRAELIEALTNSLTPAISINNDMRTVDNLNADVHLILEEITRFLNMEKLLPSYRNTITISCLKAIRQLQKNGHIPSEASLFRSYAEYGHFVDVRVAALEALVDYTRVERSSVELQWLVSLVQSDPSHYVRHKILAMLCKNPPFTKKTESTLCDEALVDQLWKLMNSGTAHDWRLRCDAVNLYYVLFGLTRPSCLPLPELGLVLNLKEKKAVLNPTIKPELIVDTAASIGIHGVGISYPPEDDEPDPISLGVCGVGQPPQGIKRKAETQLGSPPEPGQAVQHLEDDNRAGRYKIRFNMEEEDIDMETVHDSQAFIHHHLHLLDRPSTPGKEPALLEHCMLSMPATPVPSFSKETSALAKHRSEHGHHHHEHKKKKKKKHKHKHKHKHENKDREKGNSHPYSNSPASGKSAHSPSLSE
ncbi:transcription initiation factor TFIID subunit 2 isoform X2 [Nerophis ophidion]|uniref:transcription initiation factor TFIID subunit 2 isoform X2 n=1 Tax=Nerophis ophidion TaxID=159077 RepID=UPI002ADF8D70|nr:transcription initiation factor TFIID subunit 2 isoform X2 [Nerophis ophidion]